MDDFHAAYEAAKAIGALDSTAFRNPVNELPDGCVQMYLRDPAGNLLEIDWPDVNTLDRSRIPEMKLLTEFAEQDDEGLTASLYLDRPHHEAAHRRADSGETSTWQTSGRSRLRSSPSGPARTHAYAAMIARAQALLPQLRERASRTEELRRLPPETERDLHDAGLFRIVQPKRVGGSEFDYVALVDFADVIGAGRRVGGLESGQSRQPSLDAGMFDKRAQDLIWNKDANALIASSFVFPAGRARKVDGGYRAAGPLAVLLGRGFQRMEHAGRHRLLRRRG